MLRRFTLTKNGFVRYNVAQLLKEPVGSFRDYYVNEEFLLEAGAKERVEGYLRLTHFDRGIWVRGDLEANVDVTCSRCLKSFRQSIMSSVSEEFRPSASTRDDVLLPELEIEEGVLTLNQDHILDLRDTLRQWLIVDEPMKPLCRIDCNGLCGICGDDKNLNPCRCEMPSANPKLARLTEILTRSGE